MGRTQCNKHINIIEEHHIVTLKPSKASATIETYNTKTEKIRYKKIPRRNQTAAVANKSTGNTREKEHGALYLQAILTTSQLPDRMSLLRKILMIVIPRRTTNTTTAYTTSTRPEGADTMETKQTRMLVMRK